MEESTSHIVLDVGVVVASDDEVSLGRGAELGRTRQSGILATTWKCPETPVTFSYMLPTLLAQASVLDSLPPTATAMGLSKSLQLPASVPQSCSH